MNTLNLQSCLGLNKVDRLYHVATFNWGEDNGAVSSSHGTTRSGIGNANYPTDVSWKNVDDAKWASGGTLYSASPITAGNNSFTKYQFGIFTGTFNQISAGLYSANTTSGGAAGSALATGLTLHGKVTTTYTQPATTTDSGIGTPTDYTAGGPAVGSGAAVNYSTTGPEGASPTSTITASGYTQYLATQLQTGGTATAGDTPTIYVALQYSQN